jgi:hypothetical protein
LASTKIVPPAWGIRVMSGRPQLVFEAFWVLDRPAQDVVQQPVDELADDAGFGHLAPVIG